MGTNIDMDDLDIADDIMALCNDHRKNCYTGEGGMQLNASNVRVISALIPGLSVRLS